jgi:hypothetical protein
MAKPRWDWPKQVNFTEGDERGDCFRCCIAAVLQIPAENVPNFNDGSQDAEAQKWLNARGYVMIHVKGGGHYAGINFPRYGKTVDDKTEEHAKFPIIVCGPTVRTKKPGQHHATVWVNGKMVYDPHPSEAGLIWVVDNYMIVPMFEPAPTLYGDLLVRE